MKSLEALKDNQKHYISDHKSITIDYSRDSLLSEAGIAILKDRYLVGSEISPQEGFARVACNYADDSAHAQRLYDYASKCWMMFSTPVMANGGTDRGLPISCFVNAVEDSRDGLGEHYAENLWLSTSGGGIGTDWSSIRSIGTSTSKGNKTTGVIPFIKVVDSLTVASWQGSTRRGATAVYLSVEHPEIEEFIEIRKPTGDANRRALNIHNAVSIPDAFMDCVVNGNPWKLVDPHTKEVTKEVDARDIWMKILSMRVSTGEPYLFFEDAANRALPEHLKEMGLTIKSSNLCGEIMLPTNSERTAVCCLSSVNLEHFDVWSKDPMFIDDLLRMLDNVLTEFIETAPAYLRKAVQSATMERSVGLGAMGFHLYLQSKGIAFEGAIASGQNRKMFKHIKDACDKTNTLLGTERGEAPDATGTGLRFSHTNAVAPNANSSILCGNTSPSIEPFNANAFTQKTHSGVFLIKNKALDALLRETYKLGGKKLDNVWQSIIVSEGSVQHLEFLSEGHKEVFKTAIELDQNWIVDHAATRQPFIDQGQSVNLFIQPTISKKELHEIHKGAWAKRLKSLYYCRTRSVGKTDTISNKTLDGDVVSEPTVILTETQKGNIFEVAQEGNNFEECLSCQG